MGHDYCHRHECMCYHGCPDCSNVTEKEVKMEDDIKSNDVLVISKSNPILSIVKAYNLPMNEAYQYAHYLMEAGVFKKRSIDWKQVCRLEYILFSSRSSDESDSIIELMAKEIKKHRGIQ